MRARTIITTSLITALGALAPEAAAREDVLLMQLLDNPNFSEPLSDEAAGERVEVPWWRTTQGAEQLVTRELPDGTKEKWLWVSQGVSAEQPLAAYGPTAGGIVITARVSGTGRLVIEDGAGREHVESFAIPVGEELELSIGPLSELKAFQEGVRPRLTVRLAWARRPARARWSARARRRRPSAWRCWIARHGSTPRRPRAHF